MTVLLMLFVGLITAISVIWLVAVFLDLTIERRRPRPLIIGIIIGFAVLCVSVQLNIPLPPSVKVVVLPLLATAITTAMSCRKSDWESLRRWPPVKASVGHTPGITLASFIVGCSTAYAASQTMLGKVVLNLLGQDVVGTMRREVIEIRIVGAAVGFFAGTFLAIIFWRCRNTIREKNAL